jgi:regulator of RNase E activity RraA
MTESTNIAVAASWVRPNAATLAAFERHSTANLGDGLERLDIVDAGVSAIWPGARIVGSALTILTTAGDNKAVIAALDHIQHGDVVIINAGGFDGRAILGDNLAQRFELFGATGAIVDGYVRDRDIIESLQFPVFARGLTPAGPFKNGPGRIGAPVAIGGVVVNSGDIIVADSDGIIVIPPSRVDEALAGADAIVALEAAKDAEVAELRASRTVVR